MPKLIIVLLAVCSSGLLLAQTGSSVSLDQQVRNKIRGFQGRATLFATNLDTGASYGISPDDPVRTASTIKLAIMAECFYEAHEGKLNWDEKLKLTNDEKVSGTGVLQDFSDGDEFPVRDLMHLMIMVSDNTATNLILNRIGGNAVNARMASLGLSQTRVMRKILRNAAKGQSEGVTIEGAKPENKKYGLGRSSPREMVRLLTLLYRGQLVSKEASAEMLEVMKHQRDHNCIGRDMKDVPIASKSGSLDHLRSDVGIVYSSRGPIAMALTVDDMPEVDYTVDNPGDLLINALSEILVDRLGTKAPASPHSAN